MALTLAGCVTPYQPRGFSGGYVDWPTGPGRHHIEVNGNGYTSSSTLRYYFHRRAMELCSFEGFNGYVGASETEANTMQMSPNYYEVAPRYGGGAYVYEHGGATVTRYGAIGDIVCTEPRQVRQPRPPQYEPQPQQVEQPAAPAPQPYTL